MEMIRKENICMVESIKDKKELFHFLAEFMAKQGQIENDEIEKIENGLWKREELSLTRDTFDFGHSGVVDTLFL